MDTQSVHDDILLVSLPFTSLQYPNLGLSLLATALRARDVACGVRYLAFDFAEQIGVDTYLTLSHEKFYQAFLGEWIFADLVFERSQALDFDYLSDVLPDFADPIEAMFITHLALSARKAARDFIERCADDIAAQAPELVGISTSFQQNLASIAFAQALKKRAPDTVIIFGGANCEAELGQNLLERFDCIDAVCNGEGDVSFPAFVEAFRPHAPLPQVRGIATRTSPPSRHAGAMIMALDDLPVPDFDDFYDRFARTSGLPDLLSPAPTIETSRGCWWGAKHHCTFCGLNGNAMTYRSKSPARAFAEFQSQAAKYGSDFVVVDNILDYAYFDSLLPMLGDDQTPYLMHYEVKSNLSPKHIAAMAKAGIRKIQPGIETLDSAILKLMKKGVSAQQNIQTLKLCAQAGIYVDWGFIFGFPGEEGAGYDRMAQLMPFLHHLQPPSGFWPVRADRFSPYFTKPEDYGITVAPSKPYRYIYAGVGDDLPRFSYHHQMSGAGIEAAQDYTQAAGAAIKTWQASHARAEFYIAEQADGRMTLVDSRSGRAEKRRLNALASAITERCAVIVALDRVVEDLGVRFSPDDIQAEVDQLLKTGVLLKERTLLLALPLKPSGYRKAPAWEQIRADVLVS